MLSVTTLTLFAVLGADPAIEADYVIRGATLYDGTGNNDDT